MDKHTKHIFYCPGHLIENGINVIVLGSGGSGGEVMDRLVRLHFGLIKTGHPVGLNVTLVDGDTVSEANIGRQRFSPYDVGQFKAELLVHRINVAYRLNWSAKVDYYNPETDTLNTDLLITCIDKGKLRAELGRQFRRTQTNMLWLDFGNDQNKGQFIFGHASLKAKTALLLPNVFSLFPGLAHSRDDDAPSCSFVEAIQHQDLMVNSVLADNGVNLLWQLFRHGKCDFHGGFINVREGTCKPLPINPKTWGFFNSKLPKIYSNSLPQ